MPKTKHITPADFEAVWGGPLSDYVKGKIEKYDLRYEECTREERDKWLRFICEVLLHPRELIKAGSHREQEWEKGWSENAKAFAASRNISDIYPHYFGKYPVGRWRGDLVKPVSADYERLMFAVIQDWLFDMYLKDTNAIYEFGCGTGHNLLRARAANPRAALMGFDWAESSGDTIRSMREAGILDNVFFSRFDFFNPDATVAFSPNTGVYTAAALEQIGNKFEPFLQFLLKKKPKVCVHIEPIAELLDETKLLDYLSLEYFKARNYLFGFLTRLRELEKEGYITIHRAQCTHIGSLFIEGYSVVVWSPRSLEEPRKSD